MQITPITSQYLGCEYQRTQSCIMPHLLSPQTEAPVWTPVSLHLLSLRIQHFKRRELFLLLQNRNWAIVSIVFPGTNRWDSTGRERRRRQTRSGKITRSLLQARRPERGTTNRERFAAVASSVSHSRQLTDVDGVRHKRSRTHVNHPRRPWVAELIPANMQQLFECRIYSLILEIVHRRFDVFPPQ